jgi:hypothetical protein
MPSSAKNLAGALLTALLFSTTLVAYEPPATPAPHAFDYDTDSFSFANETVWNYVNGSVQTDSAHESTKKRDYTRRCFVVTRAAVQFWKFARFDPKAKPLPRAELADRIREVTERSVWLDPLPARDRIVFPGYASLREISAADPTLFQANIGLGWPVYFRAGNATIAMPLTRSTETRLSDEIQRDLSLNYPTIVWLYNFPSLSINHVVVIFGAHQRPGHVTYDVYDPNYAQGSKHLDYDSATQTFSYRPTFYFKGGTVEVRAIYRGVLQ